MATGTAKTGQWSSVSSVSLPFTAAKDGILYANLNPNSSAISYYYIQDATANQIVGNVVARDGTRSQQAIPIRGGRQYILSASSNVKSISLTAYYL